VAVQNGGDQRYQFRAGQNVIEEYDYDDTISQETLTPLSHQPRVVH
jgi:hypothetical protein